MSINLDRIKPILFNIPGWHTKRKIVVFESDDWGSIRIPSKETYDYFVSQGYSLDKSPYGKDTLESNNDISALLEVLSGVQNHDGRHPIFTLNNIVANPDFEKISQDNFLYYYYEPFTETYKRYSDHNRSLELIKEGIVKEIFRPQLHGREHLNVTRWLNALQTGQGETLDLFNRSMYGLPVSLTREKRKDFQRAYDFDQGDDTSKSVNVINEACTIFSKTWGYRSDSFVAPNFFWDDDIEKYLYQNGIIILQGQRAQFLTHYDGTYKARYHYTGQKNKLGQVYLVRNCYFEPALDPAKDWVASCLREIANAFLFKKPAIISTHRVNYIGGIDPSNRDRGLNDLSLLLKEIVTIWPGIEFMSSDHLGVIISREAHK
jgi:hypothetical protein